MKTKTLKTTMAALLALACALGCGTTALAAEEWGVIPDDYVLSVPSPGSTFRVKQEKPPKPEPTPPPVLKEDDPAHPNDGDTTVEVLPSQSEDLPADPPETSVPEKPADPPENSALEKPTYTPEDFAAVHLAEINRIREDNGLSPLATDPTLTEMAQKRVEEYQSGHKRPDGSCWSTIFREYDTTLKAVGENWIGAWDDPYGQMDLLMGSEGHKANILREKAKYVGIGVMLHEDGSGISVIQLYAK